MSADLPEVAHDDGQYLAFQFVVHAEGMDQEEMLDKLLAVLGCDQENSHTEDECPMVAASSSGGTKAQVDSWCDGVYPAERRRMQEVARTLRDHTNVIGGCYACFVAKEEVTPWPCDEWTEAAKVLDSDEKAATE